MNRRYLNAVIICKETDPQAPVSGKKYHDIMNVESKIKSFMTFASQIDGARYVNFYFKSEFPSEKGHNFAFRRYVERLS